MSRPPRSIPRLALPREAAAVATMSSSAAPHPHDDLARVLVQALDDEALAALAERLRPHLAAVDGMRLLTPHEAADRLGLHVKTVVRMAREGRLPGAVKAGRGWRFPADVAVLPAVPQHPPVSHPPRPRPDSRTRSSVQAIRGLG